MTDRPVDPHADLAATLREQVAALDHEVGEVDLLVGQARSEAERNEQKRAHGAERFTALAAKEPGELSEVATALLTVTRKSVLMEAHAEVLEAKRRALVRHRDAIHELLDALEQIPPGGPAAMMGPDGRATLPPSLSRAVLTAQEDLRRDIARAMHDGPAQSLTNIVLQAQIVERLLDRDPALARDALKGLAAMVQQTLDATKNFIFDVRPMVLDDLGLVPTLRRSARDRGRRAKVPVEFDSMGHDRRLGRDLESAVFRIVDEVLGAYLALLPEQARIALDWGPGELEVRVAASRTPAALPADELPPPPGEEVPEAIRRMIEERREARATAEREAIAAAIVVLPSSTIRDVTERADSIGAQLELLGGGGEVRLVVPVDGADATP